MAEHRRPEIPFTDADRGVCRWCGESILHEEGDLAGSPNRRRRWHQDCVDEYNASDPREARRRIRKRDRGKCADCGLDTNQLKREFKAIGRGRNRIIRERGFKTRKSLWELDHIIPLIDGGGHSDENLQTLCTPCHVRKTVDEARERADRNRVEKVETPPDEPASEPTRDAQNAREPLAAVEPHPRKKRGQSLDDIIAEADAANLRVSRALEKISAGGS